VSIFEILLVLIVALIVIPPERLPEVMRVVGKVLRELRLASNTVMRELSGAIEDRPFIEAPQNNPLTAPWSAEVGKSEQDHQPGSADNSGQG
jgi:Sec-independent protein translocase protein TatA